MVSNRWSLSLRSFLYSSSGMVKVKGATLDIGDESEGNAGRGIFAVDPLLLLLLVTLD